MRATSVLLGLALVGCDSGDVGSREDAQVETLEPVPCAVENVTGTLPGVSISISSPNCRLRRGTAGSFTYSVTTTSAVPAIDVPASGSCSCAYRSTQIDSWLSWGIGGQATSGANQQYCLCDTGCCAPQDATTITPEAGTFTDTIEWSGRTWQGPSDTGNEPGDYFLVGDYAVRVGFYGYDAGEVVATLPIVVY